MRRRDGEKLGFNQLKAPTSNCSHNYFLYYDIHRLFHCRFTTEMSVFNSTSQNTNETLSLILQSTTNSPIHSHDSNDDQEVWPERASYYLDWIFPPVTLTVANICNVLAILVLSQPTMRSTSFGIYLLILALTDIIYLNSSLLVSYIEHSTNFTVNLACWLQCKLHLTILNLFSHLASWTIVAVTIDRIIVMSLPLHAHLYCTPRRALKVSLGLFITFLTIDGKEIFTVTGRFFIPGTSQYLYTFVNPSYAEFWTKYGIWIVTLLNHLTFPLLLILNTILIYFLCIVIKMRRQMTETETSKSRDKPKVKSNEIKFAKILLFVSTTSVLMNIPFAFMVLMLLGGFWKFEDHTVFENNFMWFLYKLLFAVATTHRASYFFMYCLTGEKFRNELKILFHKVRYPLNQNVRDASPSMTEISTLSTN